MAHTVNLANEFVRLEPLGQQHAAALVALVDEEMWAGMTVAFPNTEQDMGGIIDWMNGDPLRISFAVIDTAKDEVVGSTCFYDVVEAQKRLEIGNTFYARKVWGTYVNPATKLAMMTHAFETLGYNRVALRCDVRNARSISAIRKLGATHEGNLRNHRIASDGAVSDTAYFSVVASEWPDVKRALLKRFS